MKRDLTPYQYASLHFLYWMTNLSIYSFSSAFLLPHGFSSSEVGIVMTLGSIGSLLLEPGLAEAADRGGKKILTGMLKGMSGLFLLCLGGLVACGGSHAALFVFYVLCYILQTVMQPLINEMNYRLERGGHRMNFGAARACGSLGYSLMGAVLGVLTERFGISVIPLSTAVVLLAMFAVLTVLERTLLREELSETQQKTESALTLGEFAGKYRRLLFMTLGATCLMFCSFACGSYLLQIVMHVGGSTKQMGIALSAAAASEIPVMVLFERMKKRFGDRFLLRAAGVGYIVKQGILLMAGSFEAVLVSQLFQMFSFALFLPAVVSYTHDNTEPQDAVKGQSLMPIASAAAGLIGSLTGGLMIDSLGVPAFLKICFVMALLGTGIILVCTGKE